MELIHAPRTLDTFQSKTMNSHTRLRSLSFGARVGERARSSRLDARDWRNIANAAPSNPDDSVGSQGGPAALDEGVGFGTSNEPQSGTANAVPASPAAYSDTQVDSEQSDAENGAWAEAEDNQAAAGAAAAAAPVLKRGGKAQHCTLGTVSIIEMGALGARIEFFSMRDNTVRERHRSCSPTWSLCQTRPHSRPRSMKRRPTMSTTTTRCRHAHRRVEPAQLNPAQ